MPSTSSATRTALVTGGSSGIGAAIVVALYHAGFSVGITYHSTDEAALQDARKLADELRESGAHTRLPSRPSGASFSQSTSSPQVAIFGVDVGVSADCVRLVTAFVQQFGRLDVLVNCAALNFGSGTPILEYGQTQASTSAEEQAEAYLAPFRQSLDVNFLSGVVLSRLAAKQMLEQPDLASQSNLQQGGTSPATIYSLESPRWGRGRIIHISSVHGLTTLPGSTPYVCSKHALEGLSKQLAVELGRYSITSNTICPGMTCTPATGYAGVDASEVPRKGIPMHRPCRPEEIAGAAVWLASTPAASTTGISMPVDGGFLTANPQYPAGKLNDATE